MLRRLAALRLTRALFVLPQSFLNYSLLCIVYGAAHWSSCRRAGAACWPLALRAPLRLYALLALLDVEANFLVVKAYQFTNITSVTLLDSARRARARPLHDVTLARLCLCAHTRRASAAYRPRC